MGPLRTPRVSNPKPPTTSPANRMKATRTGSVRTPTRSSIAAAAAAEAEAAAALAETQAQASSPPAEEEEAPPLAGPPTALPDAEYVSSEDETMEVESEEEHVEESHATEPSSASAASAPLVEPAQPTPEPQAEPLEMPAPTDGAPAPESPQSPVLSPSSPAPAAGEDEADDMSGIDEGLEYVSEEESEGGRWDQFIGDGPPEWEGPGTLHQAQPADTTPPTQSQLPDGAPVAQPAIAAAPAETAPQIATQAFQNHQVPPHLAPHPRTTMLLGQTYTERQLAVIDAAVLALLSTGLTPEFVFGLLNGDSRAFWASVPGPKLLFFLSYFRSNGNVPPETITLIKETLRDYLPAELHDKFQVYTSDIGNNTSNGSPQPFLFAAANAAAFVAIRTAVEALKVQKVLSTPKATLVFLGVRAPPSSFVGLYGGLYLDESDASRAIVIRLLSTHLRSWRDLQVWLGSDPAHHDAVPVGMMAGGVVDWIASTLSAFPLRITDRGTTEVIWRIHTATFSTSQAVMDRFSRMLKAVRIQALEISGVSSFKRNNFNCGACRGRDHPTGLCPLKSAPGFFDLDPNPHTAPPPAVVPVAPTAADDDDFIPGLHATPNANASRGHFTSGPATRGRGSHVARGGQSSYRGRGSARGSSRGSHRGSWF